ncbi:hypothetical protein AAFF_G00338250 [Aldrovandia affinis]|uniref:Uncharacterized protein n=1 Tax=Aldrovandia affinis TaxID=143900 RepID=A0AAD7SL84_9TELE|nr:hypothetical protein AAFF_G00338250 [Aldrovandia affinis]
MERISKSIQGRVINRTAPQHHRSTTILHKPGSTQSSSDVQQTPGAYICGLMTAEAFFWEAFQMAFWHGGGI